MTITTSGDPQKENANQEGKRSISYPLIATIEGHTLRIYAEEERENAVISVKNAQGIVVFYVQTSLQAGVANVFELDIDKTGTYLLEIETDSEYGYGNFRAE